MENITVLISACGSPTAPGLINCIKKNNERNIRVVGMDMDNEPTIKYLVDSFYNVPTATDVDYVDVVLDICKKEKVNIYFPNISAEVEAVVNRMVEFETLGVILSVSNQKSISIANNKLVAYEKLKEVGIPVPAFYPIHSVKDFEDGCFALGYPEKAVCLKIVNGSGSRGVRIIDATKSRYSIFAHEKPNSFFTSYENIMSILNEVDELDEMMLVQFMPGTEYTVDLLAQNGKVLYQVGRENIVSLMSIAQESIVKFDEHAYEVSKAVVNLLGMDGNVGFDFIRDDNGTAVLMDINPRITATVSVIAAAGVNLPYLRIKQLLGEKLPNVRINYGVKLKRRYQEIYCDKDGTVITI